MEVKRTCCFTGHRPQRLPFQFDEQHPDCVWLKERLRQEMVRLITEEEVTCFITGLALGIDMICAELVLLRKSHPYRGHRSQSGIHSFLPSQKDRFHGQSSHS